MIASLATLIGTIVSCDRLEKPKVAKARVPMVEAQVFTIETTILPEKKKFTRAVIVSDRKARLTDELDTWRLFDFENGTVTTVDEVRKSFRSTPLAALEAARRAQSRAPLPDYIPKMTMAPSGRTETIAGITAKEYVAEMGEYRRELWISEKPLIDPQFLSMLIASEPLGGYSPASAAAHEQLIAMQGFPVRDHITVGITDRELNLERQLVKIEKKQVPAALIMIPRDFVDLAKESDAGRRAVSSRPSGRSTPAAGSQPSAKDRRTP